MGELQKRVLTAAAAGPLVVLIFIFAPPPLFLLFAAVVAALAMREVMAMARTARPFLFLVVALLAFAPLYWGSFGAFLAYLLASSIVVLLVQRTRGGTVEEVSSGLVAGLSAVTLGQLFVVFPLFCLFRLKALNSLLPVAMLLAVWASDSLAYFVGKNFGRHLLVPRISPKKTWEGLLGAVLGSAIVMVLAKGVIGTTIAESLGLGILLGLLGQAGDILESAAKRASGLKDSSSLIPGHGGVLDRMDSFILSAPFFFFYFSSPGIRP